MGTLNILFASSFLGSRRESSSDSEYIPFCLGVLVVWSEDLITNLFDPGGKSDIYGFTGIRQHASANTLMSQHTELLECRAQGDSPYSGLRAVLLKHAAFSPALFFFESWGVLCLLLLVKSQWTSSISGCLVHLAGVSAAEHEPPSQFLWHGEVGWLWGPGSEWGRGQGLSPLTPFLSGSVSWPNVPSKGTQFLQWVSVYFFNLLWLFSLFKTYFLMTILVFFSLPVLSTLFNHIHFTIIFHKFLCILLKKRKRCSCLITFLSYQRNCDLKLRF